LRHGGLSFGPVSAEGRTNCIKAKAIHAGETRGIRAARPVKMMELQEIEKIIEKW